MNPNDIRVQIDQQSPEKKVSSQPQNTIQGPEIGDNVPKILSASKELKFGVAYANEFTQSKIGGMNVKKSGETNQQMELQTLARGEVQHTESTRKLIDEKTSAPGKETDKYAGKEKEYGLGDQPYHAWSEPEILTYFKNSTERGYDDASHAELLKQWGPNRITPKKSTPWIVKLLLNMFGGFQLFLWIGGILSLIVYFITNFTDYQTLALGMICFLIVIGTSLFQTYQEGKSDDVMAALKALTPEQVTVRRNGEWVIKAAIELVPGDIIQVANRDKVPADIRILVSEKLKVNNASLTGENVDINLSPTTEMKTLYEAKNLARMGCNFTGGHGVAIVFSTGDHTFFGHIARSTLNIKRPDSCLTKEIKRLVLIMGVIAVSIGVLFLILAFIRGYKAVEAIIFAIGIIVANVPEGLLPQMTVALTLTAKKMQKKNVVVTNLEIIETLGAVSVICSDKTGTLTCNRMTVSHMCYDMSIHGVGGSKSSKQDEVLNVAEKPSHDNIEEPYELNNPSFKELLRVMVLGSTCIFDENDKETDILKKSTKNGDASEAALIKFAQPIRDILQYRAEYDVIHEIPFNSNNKWMLKIVQSKLNPNENDGKFTYILKGAPERVLSFCSHILYKGQINPYTKEAVNIMSLNEKLASEGERVLAFAVKIADTQRPRDHEFGEDGYTTTKFDFRDFVFVGLVSLQDPPRPGVKESIAKCYAAGIKVFMVTGDQPATAESIAKQLGLISTAQTKHRRNAVFEKSREGYRVVNGAELMNFTQADWDEIFEYGEVVFARTMPQQKQDIVEQLKKKGAIIAMTGDGVNDAPALKAAHVGIAMGSGATVAKEAGQLILLKDDFTNIVDGIQEGRLIFENLKKCICYVLASNIPELIPFLLFIIIKIPLSIETIMILLVDVGTDLAPAIALAWEMEEN